MPARRARLAVGPLCAIIALAALAVSLPYGAAHVLSMERGGTLDLQRLSGRSDARLAAVLLAGSCWALVVVAIPGATVVHSLGIGPARIGAIVLGGVAAGALMLARPRASQIDPWMLLALGVLITMLTAALVTSRPATSGAVLAIGVLCTGAAVPAVLRRIRRSPIMNGPRSWNVLRHLAALPTTRVPELSRALVTAGAGGGQFLLLVATVVLLVVAVGWAPVSQREIFAAMIVYVPLAVAAVQCSASARREDFDLLRLSGRTGSSVVLQLGAGFAASYLAVSASAAVTLLVLRPAEAPDVLRPWPLVAALVVFAGTAEGFSRRRPGAYLATAVPLLLLAPSGWREIAIVACAGLWIPIALARGRLADAKAAPLSAAAAIAASAAMGIIGVVYLLHVSWPFAAIALAMSVGAGLLVPDARPGGTPGRRAACAVAAAVGAGAAEFILFGTERSYSGTILWPHLWFPRPTSAISLMFACLCGLYAAAGLQFG